MGRKIPAASKTEEGEGIKCGDKREGEAEELACYTFNELGMFTVCSADFHL